MMQEEHCWPRKGKAPQTDDRREPQRVFGLLLIPDLLLKPPGPDAGAISIIPGEPGIQVFRYLLNPGFPRGVDAGWCDSL
jgi:hypothetical protein